MNTIINTCYCNGNSIGLVAAEGLTLPDMYQGTLFYLQISYFGSKHEEMGPAGSHRNASSTRARLTKIGGVPAGDISEISKLVRVALRGNNSDSTGRRRREGGKGCERFIGLRPFPRARSAAYSENILHTQMDIA